MSLLGAYKKKSSYDGYESLQLVDSGGDSFGFGFSGGGGGSGGSGGAFGLGGSIAATLGPKPTPLREEDCSTMDSSGTEREKGLGAGFLVNVEMDQLQLQVLPQKDPVTHCTLQPGLVVCMVLVCSLVLAQLYVQF